MKMHGSQGAAGSARRHMPVQGAGSKELVCPDSPGKRQSVVATEQRVSSRVAGTWRHAPHIHHACPRSLQCSPERCYQPSVGVASLLHGRKPFVGSGATYLACGWRDSPPNALYSPLCRLLQQMTRSQQMDELLDVLIESGGTHCFPVPLQGFPSKPASVCGAQCILCTPAELPELSTAFICPPCASRH